MISFRKIWNTAHGIYSDFAKSLDERRQDLINYLQGLVDAGTMSDGEAGMIFEDLTETVDYWQRREQA